MAFLIDGAVGIVTELGKCVFKQIGHQLAYIVFYNRNKKELKEQIESLETTKKDVDLKVEVAKSKGYEILEEVSKWLADVDDEKKKHDELSNSNPPCFNFLQRHQLSRKAKKMATDISKLKDRGNNFPEVGCPAPLPDTKNTIVPEGYQILESKISMAKQIKDALAKPEVKKVGIYGMGGVGKTYLLNEVKKLVLTGEDKLFDLVIDVKVGQSNDVMNMQQQIGDFLNNEELSKSKEGRASFLRNALEKMKGNILITFDDLWDEIDLIKDVGIPLSKEGCKILMTSRFQNILANKMNIKECFEVTCLDDKESWKFFMKIIGDKLFDTIDMENIAREVAEECGGLPLALDIIAKTLKGKDINYWEEALRKLKNSIPVHIKDVGEKVYASLKLSCEYLDGEEAKSLFLLCSVFPDDHEISVKDLQMYVMGMRLLKMVNTWKEARTETHYLVEDLTSSSLLQRHEDMHDHVRMHDIVRDVAIYIGLEFNMSTLYYGYSTSSKGLDKDKCGSYRAIYCKKLWNLTPNMKFPKLDLLIFDSDDIIVDAYFEGMGNLKVLDMRGTRFLQPFWTSLKNLRTLLMIYCWCHIVMDTIGHLKKLEILRISNCGGITELPTCMCELKQLKVLDVSGCSELLVIRTNIISSMTKLEELDISNCFNKWGEKVWYKNTWIQNAQLSELNCLSHLFILRVHVSKPTILSEALSSQILKNLREFFICVDRHQIFQSNGLSLLFQGGKYKKNMYFNMESQIGSVNMTKFNILLEGTEMLMIENGFKGFANDIFKAIGNGYPVLKCLLIFQNTETPHFGGNTFTSLEWLILRKMMILESIVPRHASTNPFNKLEGILIGSCKQLRNLFSLSIYKGLSNLREINIDECDMMDEIVSSIEIEDHTTIFSSPLKSLVLSGVNKLISFCSTKPSIQQTIVPFFDQRQVSFPQLEYLSIDKADNLEMLWHNNGSSFSKLKTMEIRGCNKLRCVFPSNIVTSLVSLDTLVIRSCELLEMVFEIEKRTISSDTKVLPLRNLSLDNLPQLKYVWNKDVGDVLAFPILTNVVDVAGCCPKLKSIFPDSYTKYKKKIKELKVEEQNEILPVLDGASKLKQVVLLQSLVDLQVRGCHSMINLFSASVAKNLVNLSSIAIYDCREMTSIVAAEAEDEEENVEIVFNKLTRMDFDNLARLECFYSGKCTMEFPILNELSIERCDDMKIFSYGITNTPTLEYIKIGEHKLAVLPTQGINDIIHAFFALEFGSLHGLRNLELSLKLVKRCFWRHKPESFSELKKLKLVGCEEDENIVCFPLEMREVLYNIEKLEIEYAHHLVQVFENEELSGNINNDVKRCAKLKELRLYNLPKLMHVWKESSEVTTISFDSLERIYVVSCENLKCILPSTVTLLNLKHLEIEDCNGMSNLFRSSVAQNLGNLESIEIVRCREMRCIVAEEAEENDEIVFNKLTFIKLAYLARVECFYSGKCTLKFPILNELRIERCYDMKIFSHGITNTPTLEYIKIGKSKLSVLPTQGINDIIHAFFTLEFGSLHGLRNLELSLKSVKRCFWHHKPESFFELKKLKLVGCEEDENIVCFPLEMREVLYNIEKLEIEYAHHLVQVFENEELSGNINNDVKRCAKLKELRLYNLPKLMHVWKESSEVTTISFDSLERIYVVSCENLKCILPSTVTLLNLKHLEIEDCNGMSNLFRSSVAQNLGNLESLLIGNCREMRCIVAEEEEEENGEIVFKHLNNLYLYSLPRLVGFHTGKCMIKFPSLETLCIDNCKEMETFSVGVLSSPKLISMEMDGIEFPIFAGQDINMYIGRQFQKIKKKNESVMYRED